MASASGGVAGDTTAPTLTLPLGLPLGDTSGYLGVTTNEGNGTLYYVVTTSATPPSAAQVKAGQDHTGSSAVYAGNQSIGSTGAKSATATGLSSNTAYYAYFMHEDASANQSSVSAASSFTTLTTGTSDTSFDNLIAAAAIPLSDLRKGYVARFIGALYIGAIWSKIDVLWVLAAHDEQFGRLNWKSPGSFTLTAVNSPTFTTDSGFAGNGSTSKLDTGWDMATNAVQASQNNAAIWDYSINSSGSNVYSFGTETADSIAVRNRSGTGSTVRVNGTTDAVATAGGALPQMIVGRRTLSTTLSLVRDGVEVATSASTSAALSSVDLCFGRAGAGGPYSSARKAIGGISAYLDDTEVLAAYNACHDYLVALGADT